MKLNYFPNNVISQIILRFQPQNLFNLLASSSANLVDLLSVVEEHPFFR